MQTYISILRGINVSGQKKILMADLKVLYESLGFTDVITYIQSGNVIFRTSKKTDTALNSLIEKAIKEKYSFDVPVLTRNVDEWQHTINNNPFLKKKGVDTEKLHVTFLAETPAATQLEAIKKYSYPPDEYIISGKDVYLHCPDIYGNTKLSNSFFESKLKVKATTRNWKTVLKLLELAQ